MNQKTNQVTHTPGLELVEREINKLRADRTMRAFLHGETRPSFKAAFVVACILALAIRASV